MITTMLPNSEQMYDALVRRDPAFDGIFFTGVRTTGIFCRPICPAKKPARENVEFFADARSALFAGYRPCKRCEPLATTGEVPAWLEPLISDIEAQSNRRWTDEELRSAGLDPTRVRRWFKQHLGMTFHAYRRAQRVGRALATLREGESVTGAAYDVGYESLSAFYDAFRQLLDTTPARAHEAAPLHFTRINTPLGPMLAAATDDALVLLEFIDRRMLETQLRTIGNLLGCTPVPGANAVLQQTERELAEYFAGERQEFTVPLYSPGSEFQQSVWGELLKVPYAQTRSYGEQARRIGKAEAVRAVARTNGENRIAIIIPCHRIVGANGKLTGYGGGLWRKKWLLDHELKHGLVLR
jgi:AraC family transcriptional regulator of adaptative response/methylated-DNA-[protein]-cysteine methyltransferase